MGNSGINEWLFCLHVPTKSRCYLNPHSPHVRKYFTMLSDSWPQAVIGLGYITQHFAGLFDRALLLTATSCRRYLKPIFRKIHKEIVLKCVFFLSFSLAIVLSWKSIFYWSMLSFVSINNCANRILLKCVFSCLT